MDYLVQNSSSSISSIKPKGLIDPWPPGTFPPVTIRLDGINATKAAATMVINSDLISVFKINKLL